jgi:GT2 family glycosyltransferase
MKRVSIIIPVYNAFDVTIDCLQSVSIHSPTSVKVVVIDDASPSGILTSVVPENIKNDPRFVFIRNDKNLGFVGSCNRGMIFESCDDVILLNSDTVVTPKWVQKLARAAYSRPNIGTVTPLTNNGTIASVPRFLENNEVPLDMNLDRFADAIDMISAREYISVPTCVGFCTYIRRDMLDAVGVFDPIFKKGYTEENDLSLRGAAHGFDNIIDDATYVYHRGSMSFKEMRESLSQENLRILNQRYPGYDAQIASFCGANPLSRVHDRIWNYIQDQFVQTKDRTALHILSNGPFVERGQPLGDIEHAAQRCIISDSHSAHFSLVASQNCFYLIAHLPCGDRSIILPQNFDLSNIIANKFFGIIHLHDCTALTHSQLRTALERHGNYLITLHNEDAWRNFIELPGAHNLLNCSRKVLLLSPAIKSAVAQICTDSSKIEVYPRHDTSSTTTASEWLNTANLYEIASNPRPFGFSSLARCLQPGLALHAKTRMGRFNSKFLEKLVRLGAA